MGSNQPDLDIVLAETRCITGIFFGVQVQSDRELASIAADLPPSPINPSPPSDNSSDSHAAEKKIAFVLKEMGDKLDRDASFNQMMKKLSPDDIEGTLSAVLREMFSDGIITWGRIVMLFTFAFKLFKKAVVERFIINGLGLLHSLVQIVFDYIKDHIIGWIVSTGGWSVILQASGASNQQIAVVSALTIATLAFVLYRQFRSVG